MCSFVDMITTELSLYMTQMIRVKLRKSNDQVSTSAADDTATTSTVSATAETSDEPPASASENDDEVEDETQDEMTCDELRPLRLELTPESQLDSTEPIYVDLLDSSAPVTDVLKWLTSATWYVCVYAHLMSTGTHTQPFYCSSGICPGPPG